MPFSYDIDNFPKQAPEQTPEVCLWAAVLESFIKDALARLNKDKPNKDQLEAFNDLIRAGSITRRIAKYNDLDPEWMSEQFRLYVQSFYQQQAA